MDRIIGATVVLVALYLFIYYADESSSVIRALSGGYAEVVGALQGRGSQRRILS